MAIINFDCRNELCDRETSDSVMVKRMLVEIFMPKCCMCIFVEKNIKIITQPFSLSYLYPLKVFRYKVSLIPVVLFVHLDFSSLSVKVLEVLALEITSFSRI